jgi:rubredoxin
MARNDERGGGGGYMGGGGGGFERREGDWICPSCNANVFAKKFEVSLLDACNVTLVDSALRQKLTCVPGVVSSPQCFKCKTPKPGGGGGGGFGGGAPRRDGDWNCPSCGAMVFGSKSECFKCRTPKPGGVAVSSL